MVEVTHTSVIARPYGGGQRHTKVSHQGLMVEGLMVEGHTHKRHSMALWWCLWSSDWLTLSSVAK
jgi:hypothetical protein